MRLQIKGLVYRLADAANEAKPSVIGALHLGDCDIHVRLPWQQNVLCTCTLPLQGILTPPMAHVPVPEYEAHVAEVGEDGWLGSLHEVARPSEFEGAPIVYKCARAHATEC